MNLIIDASNIIHRSFWISQKSDVDGVGDDSNLQALLFLKSLRGYCNTFKPKNTYCVWDKSLGDPTKSFRAQLAGDTYKQNRDSDKRDKVYEKYDTIIELLDSLGCYNVYPYELEGDDVIAFLSDFIPGKKTIVSADRDLFQLIDADTSVFNVTKKSLIHKDNFNEMCGMSIDEYIEHKSLSGDSADNISSVITPSKIKKYFARELVLNEDQQKRYDINFKLMKLDPTLSYQEGEYDKMVAQVNQLESRRSMKRFIELAHQFGLNTIINEKSRWQETFFTRNSMVDIVRLLR